MPEEERIFVSLSFRSKHLVPEEISRRLDLEMTHGFENGSAFTVKHTGEQHDRDYGVWQYSSELFVQSEEIDDHLEYILEIFEKRIDKLQYFLQDDSYDVALRIWFEKGIGFIGLGFYNDTLRRIMKICKGIYFTLCFDENNS